MPTYEYECTQCGHRFEIFQFILDKPLDECPQCKSKLRRLVGSGSGIIFKGSGFYATDYRKTTPKDTSKTSGSVSSCSQAKEGCDGCSQK
ncbi:MAG: hypothetical protein NC908_01020 [Candidatus Omnitrophica bacterium]|nr:hypothetical protein [Candidatus Omnitrophota bacterium]